MRTTPLVRVMCLLAIGSLGFHSSSQAQSSSAVRTQLSINEIAEVTPANTAAKNADLIAPSLVKAEAVAHVAKPEAPAREAVSVAAYSHSRSLNAINPAVPSSLIEENILNVKVDYDVRPVGGILSVRVSIAPAFRGIGVSTRPAISRSISMAVDEASDEMVKTMVADITEEIQTEFASIERAEMGGKSECPALRK
jgi:hypothetical protein